MLTRILDHPIGSHVRWIGFSKLGGLYRVVLEFPPTTRMVDRCNHLVAHRLPYVVIIVQVCDNEMEEVEYDEVGIGFRISPLTGRYDVLGHPRLENVGPSGLVCLVGIGISIKRRDLREIGTLVADIAECIWTSRFRVSGIDTAVLPYDSWPEDVLREGLWPGMGTMGERMKGFQTFYSTFGET